MKKWPGCQVPFFPTRPSMLATAVPASLREASVLRGLCGACSTASISLHSSGVASLSRLNTSAPPKPLSHPFLTPMLLTALTNPTLGQHPSLRTRIYIPGPITLLYSRSLFSLCLRPSPFSCLEHISNPTCPKPQPVTKYTGWFKSNWTPSKSYQTMWFLPAESDPEHWVCTTSSSQLGGNEDSARPALGLLHPLMVRTLCDHCPGTQGCVSKRLQR